MAIENCNKGSISIKRVKSTKIGLKETESNKACTRLIRKKSYELVQFLWSSKVHTCEYGHGRDRFEVGVGNKSIRLFRTDLLIHISKLLYYALAQLIWCSYFI